MKRYLLALALPVLLGGCYPASQAQLDLDAANANLRQALADEMQSNADLAALRRAHPAEAAAYDRSNLIYDPLSRVWCAGYGDDAHCDILP